MLEEVSDVHAKDYIVHLIIMHSKYFALRKVSVYFSSYCSEILSRAYSSIVLEFYHAPLNEMNDAQCTSDKKAYFAKHKRILTNLVTILCSEAAARDIVSLLGARRGGIVVVRMYTQLPAA